MIVTEVFAFGIYQTLYAKNLINKSAQYNMLYKTIT